MLVETYQHKIYNTAYNLVYDTGIAEDITQEVFVSIYKSILTFNEKSSIDTWIYRITINKCYDCLRAKERRKKTGFISTFFLSNEDSIQVSKNHNPETQLVHKENASYLITAVNCLPLNQKTVFILAHIEELPQKEIAEIMSLSLKAIESLLQRAKLNLRKKLSTIYDRRN